MGASCQTTDTVVVPEGSKATELGKTKDEQIAGLVTQVKDEQAARLMESALASKAASSVKGMLKVRDYLPAGLPSDAIKAEGDLALTRLPVDDPAETVKALERVVAIVTGQRDEANRLYREADAQTKVERTAKEAKDKEIAERDTVIKARESRIAVLEQEKANEQIAHAKDVTDAIARKDKELADFKAEQASKERATWVLWTRIAGLGLIVIGVVLLAVFKLVVEGTGLAAGGVIIGLISIFIDWLTGTWWFPWMMGGLLLAMLGAGGYAIYRMWKKGVLHDKTTTALQDLKDEASTLGNNAWETVSDHLKYRLGDKSSFWGAAQAKAVAALGLVNPKAEATPAIPSVPPA